MTSPSASVDGIRFSQGWECDFVVSHGNFLGNFRTNRDRSCFLLVGISRMILIYAVGTPSHRLHGANSPFLHHVCSLLSLSFARAIVMIWQGNR
ncbi:hypothetical protein BGW80DRAFT_830506 [Lactifluus volemus]|nr:hypothetical protein BGW80DRAFT_830506 [Lactifluus volemus]